MDLADVATRWHPGEVEDETLPDAAVGAAVAGIWGVEPPEASIPPLWHWFHFLDWVPHNALGRDGHPATGHFLPPVDDRRRMFAGGTCSMREPLRYGAPIHRRRTLREVRLTTGRSGDLLFVTVRAELSQAGSVKLVEDQDIVYRVGSPATWRDTALATEQPPVPDDVEHLPLLTDPALLFRMSALTANQHRIHYDETYAREVEQYPGLVVHGPLLVLHMLEIPRRAGQQAQTVSYRLHAPVFCGEPLVAIAEPPAGTARSRELRIATTRNARHASAELRW